MRFTKGTPDEAAKFIASRITSLIKGGKPVLWLVSGGSNIPIQKAAMDLISDDLSKRLTIMPVDERYGTYNHADSNIAQLRKAGFDPKHAELVDILEENLSPKGTVLLARDYIAREIAIDDTIFATLGMGADGHTAGVLPHSPALHCSDLVMAYKAPDFLRITLCADTIAAHCDEVVLCAFGPKKTTALKKLYALEDQRDEVPAMILKEIGHCTVFNDTIEGDIL